MHDGRGNRSSRAQKFICVDCGTTVNLVPDSVDLKDLLLVVESVIYHRSKRGTMQVSIPRAAQMRLGLDDDSKKVRWIVTKQGVALKGR